MHSLLIRSKLLTLSLPPSPVGVTFLKRKVDSVSHADGSSTVRLSDGSTIQGSMVLDATGHSRRLVKYDKEFNPGYQGAYGIIAGVEVWAGSVNEVWGVAMQ